MFPWSTSVAIRHAPFVTWTLIALNLAIFLYEVSLPSGELQAFIVQWGLVPARYGHPHWAAAHGLAPGNLLPFLSNTFLHGSWLHVLLNMWTLWIFGPAIEDRFGAPRYLAFYLACGIGASVAQALVNADSAVPTLGASGAIAGVMGAFMRLFPLSRVVVIIPIIIIPFVLEIYSFFFIGFWMALQVVQGLTDLMSPPGLGGIAWWAHIGGFALGFAATGWLRRRHYRPPQRDEGIWGFTPDGRRRARRGPWGRRDRKGPWR